MELPTFLMVQRLSKKDEKDIITWQTSQYGGILLATTLDPIVNTEFSK
jgi:hypothetical protein